MMPRFKKNPKKFCPKIIVQMYIMQIIDCHVYLASYKHSKNHECMFILYEVIDKNHSMLNIRCSGL